jgi:hypothetical protein
LDGVNRCARGARSLTEAALRRPPGDGGLAPPAASVSAPVMSARRASTHLTGDMCTPSTTNLQKHTRV